MYTCLTSSQILQLEKQGCVCTSWHNVQVSSKTDLALIRNCRLAGEIKIGELCGQEGQRPQGIFNAVINDCEIGDNAYISNVAGELKGLKIGTRVSIENVGRITCEPETLCGLGTPVAVLDEAGSRPVPLFPELSAQLASLMARYPKLAEYHILPLINEAMESEDTGSYIGDDVTISDTKLIVNVRIDGGVKVIGASKLRNGRIINNARSGKTIAFVGNDVDAENFMIVDGRVDSGSLLRNCFVGQGVVIDKRFTAHDTLFFANASCECGESCAVIAGPYTVTMHKSSLLIGAEYSFMNAGSGTNASNHMYKLGPVHWGRMHRGVKTSSGAYVMWDAQIGAFSLVMGAHKEHPDTSAFPFSYLFASPSGKTIVSPGVMLKSCGLMRDKLKWPKRDRRIETDIPLLDNITFDLLNPVTVSAMISTLPLLDEIEKLPEETDGYRHYSGLLFSSNSIKRARDFYEMAVVKYFHSVINEATPDVIDAATASTPPQEWIDLGGQIIDAAIVESIREAESFEDIVHMFDNAFHTYKATEYCWVKSAITPEWSDRLNNAEMYISRIEEAIEKDRMQALASIRK